MDLRQHAKELKDKGIDLDKPGGGGSNRLTKPLNNGIFSPVAFERYESSGKGTPALMIRFVVLDGPEIGKVIDADIYLTGNMYDLGSLALSLGAPEEPFDENDDEAIQKILTDYYPTVRASAVVETYEGKDRLKLKFFGRAAPDKRSAEFVEQDAQKEAFNTACDGWEKYIEWRANNPRKTPGSSPASNKERPNTASRNTGNRSGSNAGGQDPDDDIPF